MIVVDSSVWIAHLRGATTDATRKLLAISRPTSIVVGDLVLVEVLQGARDDAHAAQLEGMMRRFHIVSMLDGDLAVASARNYRDLRRAGITVRKLADLIVATFCIERGHVLLQQDRDFLPMVAAFGLRLA